jgi:opacity protein-like surface antigen
MKLKKTILSLFALVLLCGIVPNTSSAQWSIGGSYEIRDEEPENGFGVRIERNILQKLPLAKLAIRAHFSYFNEENQVENGVSYTSQITNYDYGLAGVGGVAVGPITPYVGVGLGSSQAEFNATDVELPGEGSDNNIYWNGFVGAEVSPIPVINPFVEYRFQSTKEFDDLNENVNPSGGRLIFGVSLSF